MASFYSSQNMSDERHEQTVSNGEVIISSTATVFFINSQTLEEDKLWLYRFYFFCGAAARNSADIPVHELSRAKLNLSGTENVDKQRYYISDENLKLGCVPNDGNNVGDYKSLISGITSEFVTAITLRYPYTQVFKALNWAWTGASLAEALGESFPSKKENDFEQDKFYREWIYKQHHSDISQFWDIKIEVPPGKKVKFEFSYDVWSSSGEMLKGHPITCTIQAPSNCTSVHNYEGVSYSV